MEKNVDDIVKKCQSGELEAFGLLFDVFHQKIYRFIYFRTHHKETAEDITSTVFSKALEHINSYNSSKASFGTWLYQIARNSVIDFYRASKETSNIEDAWDIPSNSSVERDVETVRQLEKVSEYLKTLPSKQRDVVIMRVWDGLSHKEIAEILGLTEANVKMTFSRTLAKLNQETVFAILSFLIINNFRG